MGIQVSLFTKVSFFALALPAARYGGTGQFKK
jgi:hypothetical protein